MTKPASPRALVTGAGARIGRAIALALGEAGHDVALHCNHSTDGAEAAAEEIRAMGRRATVVQADLMDAARVEALVPEAAEALGGPLTCLVNNASGFKFDRIDTASAENWEINTATNLRAPLFLLQAFAAQAPEPLEDEAGEKIAQALCVNMLDQRIRNLSPELITYTIAKMGLWTLTRTAAQGLGPKVRVNGIAPGSTLKAEQEPEERFRARRKAGLLERGTNPEDIVAALRYLLEARTVTGQAIVVDGGQHLIWSRLDSAGWS
ncbi:SDR family oxidoreductase [Pseudoroseicyclus tamaricis]|uniref:SDR family oxidoreductase n=1 Tax=Pseudoroseicyclus tamaricis TaxID=2705421 RepID=A0A6B2JVD7_9RHOB|nr:SDR family oxidoreductase [Pseudoroseicyclus tamaricis]NDV02308.1 SDR family oxidoreductase [Pseudoroseicyclus tamaricis]